MTDLSIIIVCYKGWDRLIKCLDSLNQFKGDCFRFEVIVVDNNSGDGYISTIETRYPGFRFIHNYINGGYAHGNNLGSYSASGEYLLILNPDTEVTEIEVDKLLIFARSNPGYSLVSCRQVNENGRESKASGDFPSFWNLTGFQRSLLKIIRREKGKNIQSENVTCPQWISGSVMLIRKDLFQQLEGFYEGFWMYYEDVDLCKRVSESGGKIAFTQDITIEHNHGGSSRINVRTISVTKAEVSVSQHLYVSRHLTGAERILSQVLLVANNIVSGAVMAIVGVLLFFIPPVFVRSAIFLRLLNYYAGAIVRQSWISPRSALFQSAVVKKH